MLFYSLNCDSDCWLQNTLPHGFANAHLSFINSTYCDMPFFVLILCCAVWLDADSALFLDKF